MTSAKRAPGTDVVPMGGDEQNHAGSEKDPAQDEGDHALPCEAGRCSGPLGLVAG